MNVVVGADNFENDPGRPLAKPKTVGTQTLTNMGRHRRVRRSFEPFPCRFCYMNRHLRLRLSAPGQKPIFERTRIQRLWKKGSTFGRERVYSCKKASFQYARQSSQELLFSAHSAHVLTGRSVPRRTSAYQPARLCTLRRTPVST